MIPLPFSIVAWAFSRATPLPASVGPTPPPAPPSATSSPTSRPSRDEAHLARLQELGRRFEVHATASPGREVAHPVGLPDVKADFDEDCVLGPVEDRPGYVLLPRMTVRVLHDDDELVLLVRGRKRGDILVRPEPHDLRAEQV